MHGPRADLNHRAPHAEKSLVASLQDELMTTEAERTPGRTARMRLGAAVAIVAVVAFVIWFAFIRGDDDSEPKGPNSQGATLAELQNLPSEVGHPVYWAGRQDGTTYELTRTGRGDIYIRYLPAGVPVGDERPNFLTVGTYRFRNPYATLQKTARQDGTISGSLPNRGIYVVNRDRPNSVYVAYRGQDLQIEVFSPSAKRARQLVTSGQVEALE
jgi:hypothetical protein